MHIIVDLDINISRYWHKISTDTFGSYFSKIDTGKTRVEEEASFKYYAEIGWNLTFLQLFGKYHVKFTVFSSIM